MINEIIGVKGRCYKGLVSKNLRFLKNSLWLSWLRHGYLKKSKLVFDFCHIWRYFCRRKTYSVCFVANGSHELIFFKKYKILHKFVLFFFSFACYLVSLMIGLIAHYRCSAQSNLFWGGKRGFTASTAFCRLCWLNCCLLSNCCFFVTA